MTENAMTRAELLNRMQQGWDDLNAYLNTLTDKQWTTPTDAAGWTAKDHVMHLAVWADGINALLEKQSRRERMGLDRETWDSRDFDRMNAVIQQRHKDLPLADVRRTLAEVHARLVANIQSLSDNDLQRPYHYYQPESTADRPVIVWIVGNTFEHYAEHIPWIAEIVKET